MWDKLRIFSGDWEEKFTHMSPERRRKVLDRAVRMAMNETANQNERQTGKQQLHAALEIDPKLTLKVLSEVTACGASQEEIEKAQAQAAEANANFNGLVAAIQTLRTSLTKLGAIREKDDLPATVEEWNKAVAVLNLNKERQLEAREAHLQEQQRKLEEQRAIVLAEIEQAKTLSQINIPSVQSGIRGLVKQADADMSVLFQQEMAKVFAAAAGNVEQTLTKRVVSMLEAANGKSAGAADAIRALSFDVSEITVHQEAGQMVQGEGVFTRLWTPKYANGKPLGFEVELYSAPEDLIHAPNVGAVKTYLQTVDGVAGLRNWHGHDGGKFANDKEVLTFLAKTVKDYIKLNPAVANSSGWFRPDNIGKWFIPFGEHIDGKEVNKEGDRIKICEQNHYDLQNLGDFADTFTTSSSDYADWYWSSTEGRGDSGYVWNVRFSDGVDDWHLKDNIRLSCRPVRVGRVRHLAI